MICDHKEPDQYENFIAEGWFGDYEDVRLVIGKSFIEDIGTGAFRCSQRGYVGFYTGLWKDFYENGIPCSSSDNVSKIELETVRQHVMEYKQKYVGSK